MTIFSKIIPSLVGELISRRKLILKIAADFYSGPVQSDRNLEKAQKLLTREPLQM
jgi:hypothetical protein